MITTGPNRGGSPRHLRRRFRAARLIAVLMGCCLSLALAACGSGGASNAGTTTQPATRDFAVSQLSRFAVASSELPSGYSETKSGSGTDIVRLAQTREQAASFAQLSANGLEGYYVSTFHKSAQGNTNNPGSLALAFGTPSEASRALPLLRSLILTNFVATGSDSVAHSAVPATGLGDESLPGVKFDVGLFNLYYYVWRDRNVDALLGGGDSLGDMSGASILMLAQHVDFAATR